MTQPDKSNSLTSSERQAKIRDAHIETCELAGCDHAALSRGRTGKLRLVWCDRCRSLANRDYIANSARRRK